MKQTIYIVEDEARISKLLCDYMESAGFKTHCNHDGLGVAQWVKENVPDLILLDLLLPECSGIDICKEIRTFSQLPIIMITARTDEEDRLAGLDLGADDYICKPFSPREVVSRVKAVLRRTSTVYSNDGYINMYRSHGKVTVGGQDLQLTALEFNIMDVLLSHPGQIFSRSHLMDRIYTDNRTVSDRTIDSHIKKIRRKIAEIAPEGNIVCSVYGFGYKFNEDFSRQLNISD